MSYSRTVALTLSAVYFSSNPKKNLLREPETVALVLKTPTVEKNTRLLYRGQELRIEGTGFIGAKKVDFYFKPPLAEGVDFEVLGLTENAATLRLRDSFNWQDPPGELSIVGVDTGGGVVKLNGGSGVVVANVANAVQQQFVDMVLFAHKEHCI